MGLAVVNTSVSKEGTGGVSEPWSLGGGEPGYHTSGVFSTEVFPFEELSDAGLRIFPYGVSIKT